MWGAYVGLVTMGLSADYARDEGDKTCFVHYWVDVEGCVHIEDVSFEEFHERRPIETQLVPGSNPPHYVTK